MTKFASSGASPRSRTIAYWVTTALLVFELGLGGVWDLLQVPRALDVVTAWDTLHISS